MKRKRIGVAEQVAVTAAIFVALQCGASPLRVAGLVASAHAQPLPRRDGPQLLSRQEAQAGLRTRLQRMRQRRTAQQARRIQEQRQRGLAHVGGATAADPPREPDPPAPPDNLGP